MDWSWIVTNLSTVPMVVLSAVGIYAGMLLLTRLAGLRSFSKLSAFDFAVTVAIGSILATTVLSPDPPLFQALVALAALYAIQIGVAILRERFSRVQSVVDNAPLLLMVGKRVLRENLRKAQVTEADLRAKLREANVLSPDQIRAVVLESTGDVSVLHGDAEGAPLDSDLLEGVEGRSEFDRADPPPAEAGAPRRPET